MLKCHGPDDRARKGGLSLHTKEGALATLADGRRAVVPGKPGKSELVRRILSTDPAVMMPVPDSHLTLTDVERATLVRWIEQGATWTPHWAFVAPKKAPVPTGPDLGPFTHPIDGFIRAGLRGTGLTPSPEAPRETLIRRVSIDLTGLPPTTAEIDAFLADRSADAYEQVVDRLLASPAFGERRAADWLDMARDADSHGYQDDGMRPMSPWRDWVTAAFNRNMPVNDFTTWQLAGDLLPDPTTEQHLATAFNRHHMQSQEGGIVSEEYRVEYVADRVNTFGVATRVRSTAAAVRITWARRSRRCPRRCRSGTEPTTRSPPNWRDSGGVGAWGRLRRERRLHRRFLPVRRLPSGTHAVLPAHGRIPTLV